MGLFCETSTTGRGLSKTSEAKFLKHSFICVLYKIVSLYLLDCIVLRKVDLLAKTEEGITPLHDAVLNNRTEVCRMLLQHGGKGRLLEALLA